MQEDQFGGLDIDDGGEEADIPSYVWNMRLAEDEEDESIQGGAGGLFSPAPKSKATVNLTDVASFLRDGRKGPSFYREFVSAIFNITRADEFRFAEAL